MENPKLTVLMPVYNEKAAYLRQAIESVLIQTQKEFEFLIIDDGSTESECVRIIDEYAQKDPRISLSKNETNLGITKTLNKGIALAKTELISRMDSDDYCAPERLEKQYNFMQIHSDCALSGTWAYFVDENNRPIGAKKSYVSYKDIKRHILDYNFFTHPTWIFKKSIVEEAGGYDPKAKKNEDYDLLLRLVPKYKVLILPEFLCYYRLNSQGISWSKNKLQEFYSLQSRLKALKEYGYPKWQYLKMLRPLAIYLLVPSSFKNKIIKRLAREKGENTDLKETNLAFFFDLGGSLKTWDDFGMLTREIAIYNLLAEKFAKIYFLTYGDKNEFEYKEMLAKNIVILPKKISLPNTNFFNLVYEFLMPFCHFGKIKDCRFYKTNQNFGSIAPAISKILHPKSKLIVRSGYIASLNAGLYHSPWYIKLYLWAAENLSYHFCDKALIPTKQNYDILIKKYPVLKKKLLEMNNFINTDLFQKQVFAPVYDIIYVARLDKDKNHILLLEAAKNLGFTILFVGQGSEKENLEKFAEKNSLDAKFIDRVPNNELPEYYNKSRMCVFPSLHEGNPKTLLEAMSCQLPVIGLDVLGVRNIIRHLDNGWLSKPDAEELRAAIQELLRDPELCGRIGKAARAYIEENFSLKKLFLKELGMYEELL